MTNWLAIAVLATTAATSACDDDRAVVPLERTGRRTARAVLPDRIDAGPGWIGSTTPRHQIDVPSKVNGELRKVYVQPGDTVQAGDKIADIDPTPTENEIQVAEGVLRSARADRDRAESAVAASKVKLERSVGLLASGGTSQQAVDDAELEHDTARANLGVARARTSTERARVKQLKLRLKETTILAPFSGKISTRYRDPGVLLGVGDRVVRLISADGLWVTFGVPARDISQIAQGRTVTVWIEATEKSVQATVATISPEQDQHLQLVIVEAILDPDDELTQTLRPGDDVRVRI